MARRKSIKNSSFPSELFSNAIDMGLFVWMKKNGWNFQRNVRTVLLEEFRYGNESVVKQISMLLHYVIVPNEKTLAVILLKSHHYGVHPNFYRIPLLKKKFLSEGVSPMIYEVWDTASANEALKNIYQEYQKQKPNLYANSK
ncbi:MAG: hypothetical protein HY063_09420 [Bacteroidetes bacterium]|nr:hypothetical protein [Bacteroidota bacterium]